MAEVYPSSTTTEALIGTTDATTGVEYLPTGARKTDAIPLPVRETRRMERINRLLAVEAQGRIYRETIPGLDYAVTAMDYTLGGTHKTFAGATGQTFDPSATNYIYINSSNVLDYSTSGWPSDKTTFFPIAVVVCGASDVESITDARGWGRNVVPQTTSSGSTGTTEASWTIDSDNAGAAAATQVRFNRGSDDAEDAAIEWVEADALFKMRQQHSTDTLAGIDCVSVQISGVTALDGSGAAKVASGVAGDGLLHTSGVLSVRTSSATGTSISGGVVAVDPSDGIALDANGVAVNLTSNGGLQLSGSSGSKTLGAKTDGATTALDGSGNIIVANNGLSGLKFANQSTSSGTPGTGNIVFQATLVAGNTVTIHNANAPFKYRVIDAWSIATSADGGTWKLDNGTNDITNAVTVTGADKTRNAVGTLDDAYHEIASSGTLRVVGDGALADCIVYISVVRVA